MPSELAESVDCGIARIVLPNKEQGSPLCENPSVLISTPPLRLMLLSTRDRSQDIPHNTPDSPFLLPFNTFKRSSIPHNTNNNDSISPTSTAGHQLPQVMSSPSTSSYPNSFDRNDSARRNIGRQILPTRVADHEQKPTQYVNTPFLSFVLISYLIIQITQFRVWLW